MDLVEDVKEKCQNVIISNSDGEPSVDIIFLIKIKPKSDYPLKTLYPRAFQTGLNRLIYYDFTTVE